MHLFVIIEPREKFNLKREIDIGVPRGIQWWESGNPLKCKVTNVAITPISISKGVPVATVYSLNNFDIGRIQSLLKPLPQACAVDERPPLSVPERQTDSRKSTQNDNLDEVIGQLLPSEKEALMEVPKDYADVFAANPKAILNDPNSASYVCPTLYCTPEERNVIQTEIEKLRKVGTVLPSTSQYASCCHTVREKDGTVREVHEARDLNARFKAQSGGLWEYIRCGFGLKTMLSAFVNYVGGSIIRVKEKSVRKLVRRHHHSNSDIGGAARTTPQNARLFRTN